MNLLRIKLVVFLAIISSLVFMGVSSFAAVTDFDFDSNTGKITRYNGTGGDVVIPSKIGGVTVKIIGDQAFDSCNGITSILIPNTVKTIEERAFSYNSMIKSITIPSSVTSIGVRVFKGCTSLTTISVNSNNLYFTSKNGALLNKAATKLITCPEGRTAYTLPDTVTRIGNSAFYECQLSTITISPTSKLTSIDMYAFSFCSNLKKITLSRLVTNIGYGAFDSDTITIYGKKGSYAQTYANNNNIPFVII